MPSPTPANATPNAVPDAAIREQALNSRLCCIVQAPAGSGKTEILIQRILVLLAEVERPEQILAITFTKKAASEMRQRVLRALDEASDPLPANASEHLRLQRQRAQAALARDNALKWNLLQQPARLGIQTIDSLCASLAARLPLSAGYGAPSSIDNTPQTLYLEAATRVLARIETSFDEDDADTRALETLLPHLGNNLARVRDLLAAMLARRDQWLRHTQNADQAALEAALLGYINAELRSLDALIPPNLRSEIGIVTATMCANLEPMGVDANDPRMLWQVKAWPKPKASELACWQGLAEHLLTTGGTWRKRLTNKEGVLAPSEKGIDKQEQAERSAFKSRVSELLSTLGEQAGLEQALQACRSIPVPCYAEKDWNVLAALLKLLNLSVAELNLIFAMRGTTDYVENALVAQRALGNGLGDDHDEPSDLLLALDYRLRHILIDEFQDTSTTQFELLKKLIAGWQAGEEEYSEMEGRSLFLVGDPMQSIYRFREAEVGLFLLAQREGIGDIRLKPLELSTNFRSQAGIVHWVNRVFPQVLAPLDNIFEGAVRYAEPAAEAFHPEAEGEAVRLHLLDKPGTEDENAVERGVAEAQHLVSLVQQALAELAADGEKIKDSDRTIAILVRSRSHLAKIIPALRKAEIAFQAVEIERLAEQPMVHDLMALTRALLHPADRIAWLAILRAPWCGLSLHDLHTLVADAPKATLWQLMQDEARLDALSADGRARLLHLRSTLTPSLAENGRIPLRRQVEGLWLALGGARCVTQARELSEAEIFFDLLDALHQEHGGVIESAQLEKALQNLYAPPDTPKPGQPLVQLMTIHKSKGLQFHSVILPGLARIPRNGDSPLLLWREVENAQGKAALLLAPIKAAGEGKKNKAAPSLYAWLQEMDAKRETHETGRLLYVAATRAIQRLHLVAETPRDMHGAWNAPARSLLNRLWPGIEWAIESSVEPTSQATPSSAATQQDPAQVPSARAASPASTLRRVAEIPPAPIPPSAMTLPQTASILRPSAHASRDDDWQMGNETPRHVGTLLHRLLERIALDGLHIWDARLQQASKLHPMLSRELLRLGLDAAQLDSALEQVFKALNSTLTDPRGRWILSAQQDAHCEWALGGLLGHSSINAIIDRSFVEQNTRWIIDYKTASSQQEEGMEHFLDRQQALYRDQLESYAHLLRQHDAAMPIKLGIYFPSLAQWREWPAPETQPVG